MKKTHYLQFLVAVILGLFLFSACGGPGKMAKNPEKVTYQVTPEVLEAIGGKVNFKIEAKIPPKYFEKKAVAVVIPEIKYPTGSLMLEPKVLVGEKVSQSGYQVISKKDGGTVVYQGSFDYAPEMEVSELQANVFIMSEKDFITISNPNTHQEYLVLKEPDYVAGKLADGIIITSTRIINQERPTLLAHGYEKITKVSKSAYYYFPISSSNYSANMGLNKGAEAKDRIAEVQDFLKLDWAIDNVVINGWASPDGENRFNNKLSEARALAIKKIWDKNLAKKNVTIEAKGNGQDWDGYIDAVNKSSLSDKSAALAVVNYNSMEQRETAIASLVHKNPSINTTILEPLRRAILTITCLEPKFTDNELASLAISDPDQLKEPELLYAATLYPSDLDKQYIIYKNAVQYFPNSVAANNNAGAVALMQFKNTEAATYIQKAESIQATPEVRNNLGVIAAREGKIDEALAHYNAAKTLSEAQYNLGLCEIAKGNFAQAQALLGNEKCSYGYALAQLVTNKTDDAIKGLDCIDHKDADVHYLMAVAYARKGDKNNMAEHLKEACSMKGELKAVAKNDREFIKYYNEQIFLDAIK